MTERDRRALDVPARSAPAEGRVPRRLARPGGLPEQAVERVLLPGPIRITTALRGQPQHLVGRVMTDLAEVRSGGDREVDVTIELVCRAAVAQRADDLDDAGYRLNRSDVVIRSEHP